MKFCDERIQNHLLNGGTIRKIKSKAGWNYRPIKLDDEVLVFADNGDNYVITKDDLIESANKYGKSPYGEHVRKVADGRLIY